MCSSNSNKLYLDTLKDLKTKLQLAWEHSETESSVKMNRAVVNCVIIMSFLSLLWQKYLLIFPCPEEEFSLFTWDPRGKKKKSELALIYHQKMSTTKFTFLKMTTNASFLQRGINNIIYKSFPTKTISNTMFICVEPDSFANELQKPFQSTVNTDPADESTVCSVCS